MDTKQAGIRESEIKMLAEDHRYVMDGVRLAMDIIESKVSNNMGYAFLVLNRADGNVGELVKKCSSKEIAALLEKERKEIKQERDTISSKMFPYELKGLDDWKKYLRGKFFEEEKTIQLWYRMVSYLNGGKAGANQSFKAMADSVKSILY